MSNLTIETGKAPVAGTLPEQPPAKPHKRAKRAESKAIKRTSKKTSAKAARAASNRTNKKAEVIALMKRAKGVTLAQITKATGWQKHTVRGFVSLLGSKGGYQIESSKNATGDRTYKIKK